jgi:ribosomal protein L14
MIYPGTLVKIVDNTGVLVGKCIKTLSVSKREYANIGDKILIIVYSYSLKKGFLLKEKKKAKFKKGKKFRALVIRTKSGFCRNLSINI